MKLSTRLILFFLLMAFIPTSLIAYFSFANGQQAIENNISTHLSATTLYKFQEFNRWVFGNKLLINNIANRPLVWGYVETLNSNTATEEETKIIIEQLIKDHLIPSLYGGNYLSLSILKISDGRVIASTDAALMDTLHANESYFIKGQNETFASPIFFSPTENQAVMYISTPLINRKGKLLGILLGRVNTKIISEIMASGQELTSGEETFLADSNYYFVIKPRLAAPDAELNHPFENAALNECFQQKNGIRVFSDYRGVDVIGAYRWIPGYNLCILTKIDQEIAFEPIHTLQNQIIWISLLSGLLISISGFFISRSITTPLKNLQTWSERFGRGELNTRIKVETQDELGMLANEINQMADSLSKSSSLLKTRLEKFYTYSSSLIAVANFEGYFVELNPAWEKKLGYTQKELMSQPYIKFIHPDDQKKTLIKDKKLTQGESDFGSINRYRHKNGTWLWLQWESTSDFASQLIYGSATDISAQVIAEENLRASEAELRALFAGIPDIILVIDAQGKLLKIAATGANEEYQPSAALIDQPLEKYLPVERATEFRNWINTALKTKQVIHGDYEQVINQKIFHFGVSLSSITEDTVLWTARDITAQKIIEKELLNERLLLQSSIQSMKDGLIVIDNTGTLLLHNSAAEKILGVPINQTNILETIHQCEIYDANLKPYVSKEDSPLYKAIQGEIIQSAEMLIKQASDVYITLTSSPLIDDAKNILGSVIVLSNITNRLLAEKAVRDQADLLDLSHEMIIVRDLEGRIQFWNNGAQLQYGFTKEEANLKIIHTLLKTKFPTSLKAVSNTILTVGHWEGELIHTCKDGTIKTVSSQQVLKKNALGEPESILEINFDISDRKATEEELRTANARFTLATKAAQMGVWEYNPISNQLIWDDQMFSLYGVDRNKFSGAYEAWLNGLHPEDQERENKNVALALSGKKDFNTDFRVIWPDGSIKFIRGFGYVERDKKGQALKMTGINFDITEQKEALENIKTAMSNLAASNAELEQFAYVASHDLQEPLRMVTSYMQLLSKRYKGRLDKDADEFIEYAVTGSNRMKRLINDLLDFSRVGSRAGDFKLISSELVLNEALNNLKIMIEENQAEITHDPLPSLVADKRQITQVFQNLINNSIKFRRSESPKIHISARMVEEESNKPYWEFKVKDNGIGMEPRYFDRVFVLFQRLHNKEKYSGTGIGLAICKKIIDRHGGKIWAESNDGDGSSILFTIKAF